MGKGFRNNLAKQMAEHLVCAELGRRGLVATPFSGNVPAYDVLVADSVGRALPIQVKATRHATWPSDAQHWMDIELDAQSGVQRYVGLKPLPTPDLVHVCVALASLESGSRDRFFVLTMAELQAACERHYKNWMDSHGWRRPRKFDSFDLRYEIGDLEDFENNWTLIGQLLEK